MSDRMESASCEAAGPESSRGSGVYQLGSISVQSERTYITFAGYERDVARRRLCGIHFMEMKDEETTLEWWFVGSLIVLSVPVLAIAYILWDAYCVTTR